MKRDKPLSDDEAALAARSEHAKLVIALPIDDPFLAGVSELLHRIMDAQSLEVARWQAGDALVLLREYVKKQGETRQ
ncbi:hypothetical protein ACFSHT_22285 [Paraburkholderia silviterrae]|uniref:Uncharacterized protein n=1 Tax=Paraburkholderia silviterrae TaxID=2528715 RepID=A0A4R5MF62_9BURK|nr:hypothetical protein [Paraburkholderia silviterrae]TDG25888.1 hypothetical protein EYW47_00515 [Paraburkholderia silviterrae]